MVRDIKGKSALVTGAGRGIGRAIAMALAERGVNLALLARTERELQETSKICGKHGVKADVIPFDLSKSEEIPAMVDRVISRLGALNILINNAGVYAGGPSDSADLGEWDRGLDLNVRALMHLSRLSLPHIEKESWGAVINIASIAGKLMTGSAAYVATKHAVVGFTAALFEDVREKNIKVCAICPGFVNTGMARSPRLFTEKMIQPQDVAE